MPPTVLSIIPSLDAEASIQNSTHAFFSRMVGIYSLQQDLEQLYFSSMQKTIHGALAQSYSIGNGREVKKKCNITISATSFLFLFKDLMKYEQVEVVHGVRKIELFSIKSVLHILKTCKRSTLWRIKTIRWCLLLQHGVP